MAVAAVWHRVSPFTFQKLPGPFSQNEEGANGGKECPYVLRQGPVLTP